MVKPDIQFTYVWAVFTSGPVRFAGIAGIMGRLWPIERSIYQTKTS
jgi:hypothetical protein